MRRTRLLSESADHRVAEFCRELARPIALFDEHSLTKFLLGEIGEFFRKWRPCPAQPARGSGARLARPAGLEPATRGLELSDLSN